MEGGRGREREETSMEGTMGQVPQPPGRSERCPASGESGKELGDKGHHRGRVQEQLMSESPWFQFHWLLATHTHKNEIEGLKLLNFKTFYTTTLIKKV